jgi:hypothetical protein
MAFSPPATALQLVSDYLTDARVLLQDQISPFRYPDSDLVVALNVALQDARRIRPDIFLSGSLRHDVLRFIGIYSSTNETQAVNIEESFRPTVLLGMVAHALARDQEDTQDARAAMFRQYFVGGLRGLDT